MTWLSTEWSEYGLNRKFPELFNSANIITSVLDLWGVLKKHKQCRYWPVIELTQVTEEGCGELTDTARQILSRSLLSSRGGQESQHCEAEEHSHLDFLSFHLLSPSFLLCSCQFLAGSGRLTATVI